MKAEKKVRTYTRRTKSGKTVTVKAHTAKYEAADKKRISKKEGAGEEFLDKVKKGTSEPALIDESKEKLPYKRKPVTTRMSKTRRWFNSSPQSFSKVTVSKDKYGGYRIDLSDGSGQIYGSKAAANKDAKLLKGMYKDWKAKETKPKPKSRKPVTKKTTIHKEVSSGDRGTKRKMSLSKKSTPSKIDAGKSVMNLPIKGIPTYPVRGRKTKK